VPQYLDPALVRWSVSRPFVVTVTSDGAVSGKREGNVTVTARYQKLTAKAAVTVAGTVTPLSLVTPADGRTRTYQLYVPAGYRTGTPTPLLLAYHGGGGTGSSFMNVSQLNVVAHEHTLIVAYPDGTGASPSWNGGGCCGEAMQHGVDDVEFARLLIAGVSARVTVDPRRVYATGASNGAVMVHRLGVEVSDLIAAIAPVAGGILISGDFTPAAPTRAVPVMEFHGTTDQNFPYDPAIPRTITYWLNRNDIPDTSGVVSYRFGIEACETYTSASAEVTLCTADPPATVDVDGVLYDGGGHAWPGGVKVATPDADIPTHDIDASASIWQFFARHPLN
jgi:polyhydroxybutyrate depolymerase